MPAENSIHVIIVNRSLRSADVLKELIEFFNAFSDVETEILGMTVNGLEALEMTHALRPHVVVTGLGGIERIGGLTMVKRLRDEAPFTRVVVVSDLDDPQTVRAAQQAGVIAHLPSPPDPEDLIAAIHEAYAALTDAP